MLDCLKFNKYKPWWGDLNGLAGDKVGVSDAVDGAHSELVGPALQQSLQLIGIVLNRLFLIWCCEQNIITKDKVFLNLHLAGSKSVSGWISKSESGRLIFFVFLFLSLFLFLYHFYSSGYLSYLCMTTSTPGSLITVQFLKLKKNIFIRHFFVYILVSSQFLLNLC